MSEFENNTEIPEPQVYFTPPYVPEEPRQTVPDKAEKSRMPLMITVLALCFSLLGSAVGAGLMLMLNKPAATVSQDNTNPTNSTSKPVLSDKTTEPDAGTSMLEGDRESSAIDITKIDTSKLLTAAEVYALNVNSTVGITTSITTNYWGFQSTSAASGSGFIISTDGYILTNHHVIEDSNSITVTMYDGEDYSAKLVGYDESNDIAVLKIEATDLVPVVLGDSDNLNVGDPVVAIGNPLGELTFSLTSGAVSAKDREVTFSNGVTMDLIQTDCAINSGNSGGALFNLYGEVIGVTNAKYSGSGSSSEASIDNIGFAIPLNSVRGIVESIIEKGYISTPYLGVSVTDVDEAYTIYGLPMGAAIQKVNEDSPAADAGLKVGDIVTKAGTKEITCGNDLVAMIASCKPGDTLVLTVYRSGKTLEITVKIGEQIQNANQQQQQQQQQQQTPSERPY